MDLLKQPIDRYLAHRLGVPVMVEEAAKFARGSSRETWFVSFRRQDGPLEKLVFRADHPSGSTIPTSLEQEYGMYVRLGRTAVPIARALWWDDDPAHAARPFFVREQIEGSWELPDFINPDPRFDDYRIAISKEHLRNLAVVHTADWRAAGFEELLGAPRDEADCGAHCLRVIREQLATFQCEAIPVMEEAFAWLAHHAPPAPRISLCKGTNGLGEEVFRDGKIVAMSDWEEALIGDPANDFAHLQNFLPVVLRDGETIWSLPQALDYYHKISGIRVTPESVSYYGVMRALRMVVFGHRTAAIAAANPDAHIRQTWTGTEVMHVGKQVLGAAIGLCSPPSAELFAELNETVE
ncbi:phosphotransferase family protein [Novosphingobium lentum]|uniref:phosphotransferase family protein n=1 Tax=Novosphingobium lentum TaxID=145287 RepID=UPI0008306D43|nr:phosphotransferase family protein [Novosphingobium lentum]